MLIGCPSNPIMFRTQAYLRKKKICPTKTIWVFLLLEKIKIKNLGFDNLTY